MSTPKKEAAFQKYTQQLQKAKAVFVADYQGLTHKQLEDLRKALKKVQGEFTIIKNRLFQKALTEQNKTLEDKSLDGTTGALFAYDDEVAPVKEMLRIFKDATKGTVKAGFLGQTQMGAAEIEKMAKLPGKDQLRSQLVGQLKAPLFGLHYALGWNLKQLVWALEAVRSKKSS